MRKSDYRVYFFLVLALIPIYVPIWYMLVIALTPHKLLFHTLIPSRLTFVNFVKTVLDDEIMRTYRNSWVIASSTAVVTLAFASLGAYGLSRYEFTGRNAFILMALATQMFPMEILAISYFPIIRGLGFYNKWRGVILLHTTITVPFCTLMLKSVFDAIPKSIEEAATIDGCSSFGTFTRIVLPLSLPGITAVAIFAFLQSWIEYLYAFIFTTDSNAMPITTQLVRLMGHYYVSWETIMALSFLAVMPILILFTIFQRFFIRGLTAGAVKF